MTDAADPHEVDQDDQFSSHEDLLAGRYRLLEQIGAGGMSVVRRGYDTVLDRLVAVKLAHIDDPMFRLHLRAEARAFGRLNHVRIAQIYDFGDAADGQCFIVMELVTGAPLSRLLTTGRLDPPTSLRIGADVAEALAAVHAVGLVHRDVKPDNVLVADGRAKLVDFGISASAGELDSDPDGHIVGTPAYVAPERLTGEPVGPAADVYSLGILLYGMLTGTSPYRTASGTGVLRAHLTDDPAPLPPTIDVPEDIAALCIACLSRDPQARPTAAQAAARLIEAVGARAAARTRGRARTTVMVASGAVAVAVALGLAGWAGGGGPSHPVSAAEPESCRATFAVTRDTGTQFSATLTLTNVGPAAGPDWHVSVAFPAGQRLIAASTSHGLPLLAAQAGTVVTMSARPIGPLPTDASAVVRIRAAYRGVNLLPTDIRLNGHPCRTGLAGVIQKTPAPTPAPTLQSTSPRTIAPLPVTTLTATATTATAPAGQPPTSSTPPSTAPPPAAPPPPPGPGKSHPPKPSKGPPPKPSKTGPPGKP
ncbi:MAG TPA: serine/threonine-protein kinase [Micromonosporaceae bacterium]